MSKIRNTSIVLSGKNDNGNFSVAIEECFRLPTSGRAVMTGTVTFGRVWPNDKVTIELGQNLTPIDDHVNEIEKNKMPVKVAKIGDEIGISLTDNDFKKIFRFYKQTQN